MKLQSLLSLALLGAITVQGAAVGVDVGVDADVDKMSVSEVIRSLKRDPKGGFKHVADDGVVRSYSVDGTVIDAKRLTNEQLMEVAANHPDLEDRKHLQEVWKGVDGLGVSEYQLYEPGEHLLPPRLTDESVAEELRQMEPQHVSARGQNMKERDVLSPNVNCPGLTCNSLTFCLASGCHDCIKADGLKIGHCR